MATSLLVTKLFVPPTRAELVHRPGLIQRLNHGLDRKLTLLSAPAGFGKTTLVSHWVENLQNNNAVSDQPIKVAWLSLDEDDNNPVRFLTYFIAALNQSKDIETNIGQAALSMLQSPQPPSPNTVLISLINDLATIPEKIIFILDDYHLIEAESIHHALVFLLDNIPPQLHLVIATRQDPSLSLGRLRARAQVTELRAADLRFTISEAVDFLNRVMGLNLSSGDIAELESRTEGWIAGLQLAAISMQGRKDHTDFIKAFTGGHRLVLDFLIEEVLSQQPKRIQNFLLQTAFLDRMTGSLCDALTGQDKSQETLETLDRANLFIVPLDDERHWYRYHHLFAELLRHRITQTQADQVIKLHHKASEWYEANGLKDKAIDHAFRAQKFERAADLIENVWREMEKNHQSGIWLGWAKKLPAELFRIRPVLNAAYAWALLDNGELEAAEARLSNAEKWLDKLTSSKNEAESAMAKVVIVDEGEFRSLPVTLATGRAYLARSLGDVTSTIQYAKKALDLVPNENYFQRGLAAGLLGFAYWANGDLELASQTMVDGISYMELDDNFLFIISWTSILADIMVARGDLKGAASLYEKTLESARTQGLSELPGLSLLYIGLSMICLEQNDLESAKQCLLKSEKLGGTDMLPRWRRNWYCARAKISKAEGNLNESLVLLGKAENYTVRHAIPDVSPASSMKAQIWVNQGNLDMAMSWAVDQGLSVDDELSFLREFDHITLTRILIAQYKSSRDNDSIHNAIQLAGRLLHAAENGNRPGSVIEILILQALAHKARGDTPTALKSLERALTLAEPAGFVGIFVDEGSPMASLLYEALKREIAPAYVQRLLSAFPVPKPDEIYVTESQVDQSGLIEPLSEREIDVLQLIAKGLTNQTIADRLYLSIHTVKTHTRNIYSKLTVNNRTQAVDRARSLGILPPTKNP